MNGKSRFLKLTAAAGFLAGVAIFTTACGKEEAPVEASTSTAHADQAPVVPVAEAAMRPMAHSEVLTAEFRPFQEIEVMAKVAGYVKKINVDVGDRVHQGQVLAELEIPEMTDDLVKAQASVDRAEADVIRARAEVNRAKDELTRAQSSHDIAHLSAKRLADVAKKQAGLVAQQEVDDAHAKDMVAEAQVSSAQSAMAAAEASVDAAQRQVKVNETEVKRVQTMLAYTKVIAPFDGVVTKRTADLGSMIQAGTASNAMPIVRLSQNSSLRLTVPVPESVVPTVHVGQTVKVDVPTLKKTFEGRVSRFADKVNQSTRTMETEVDVPNPSLVLIPGMFAEVNLTLDSRPSVLTVPVEAVDLDGDTAGSVDVVNTDNKVEVRKVQLGMQDSSNYEVLSGLNAGDRVVTANRSTLRAGQPVRPKLITDASGKA